MSKQIPILAEGSGELIGWRIKMIIASGSGTTSRVA